MERGRSNIAVMIPTLNEEANLPYSLQTCSFADQVFVLDCGSTDRTQHVARQFNADLVVHQWSGYARQKNWGLDNLPMTADWVFILDADESITPALCEELVAIGTGSRATKMAGFYVNRYFVWEGKEIRHCGYYPSWNLRFFRRGKARYEERNVHEHMVVDGAVGYLKGELHHEDRRGREYLWEKHLKYADLEAHEMMKTVAGSGTGGLVPSFFGNALERRRAIKEKIWPYLPARWLLRFFYMYFLQRGFLDGTAGLDMCVFMARYEAQIARQFRWLRTLEADD